MNKKQQKKLMQEFSIKQKKEVKLTQKNFKEIIDVNNAQLQQHYKQIRVMLKHYGKDELEVAKGDYIAICKIQNNNSKIYMDVDIGNILQPLAPVHQHLSMCCQFVEFKKIWNSSVEM